MTIGTIDREIIRMEKYIPTVTVPVTIELDNEIFEHLPEKEVLPRLISTLDAYPKLLRLQVFQAFEASVHDLHETMTAEAQAKEQNS